MLIGALASGVTTHVPNYLMSVGWTTQGTGYILSVYSIVVLVATIIAGFMMDRWGIQKTVLTMSDFVGTRHDLPVLIRVQHEFCVGILCVLRAYDEPAENASVSFDFYSIRHKGLCRNLCVLNLFFLIGAAVGSVLTSILPGHLGIWHHVDDLCRICNLAVLLRDGCTV